MKNRVEYNGYMPGTIGRITEIEAKYYNSKWGFGRTFEAKIATTLSGFICDFDRDRDGLWTACIDDRVEGSIAVDGREHDTEGAQLRWFFLSPEFRGQGIGDSLIGHAMDFCKQKKYSRVYLWTFEGLTSARRLYEKYGFRLVEQHEGSHWGTKVTEQKLVLHSR